MADGTFRQFSCFIRLVGLDMQLQFDSALCTGCETCHIIFPGLIDLAEEDGVITLHVEGPLLLAASRAAFSCKTGALRIKPPPA